MIGLFVKRSPSARSAQHNPPAQPAADQGQLRSSRVGDRFAHTLAQALQGRPLKVLENVQLNRVSVVMHESGVTRGALKRDWRGKIDYLIVTESGVPLLGLSLSSRMYGRDRRRAPPVTQGAHVNGYGLFTVLQVNPRDLQASDALVRTLRPYLG